jgi:hypothetical protein
MRRTASRALIAALAGVLAISVSTPAYAASVRLNPYAPRSTAVATRTYAITTTHGYWSAVVAVPVGGAAVDLTLANSLTQSDASLSVTRTGVAGVATWWAIDSNAGRMPLGDHSLTARRTTSGGSYRIEFAEGADIVVPTQATVVTVAAQHTAVVRDVYLQPGQWLATTGDSSGAVVDLVGSDNTPHSWRVNRVLNNSDGHEQFYRQGSIGAQVCTIYSVPVAGWYGLVVINRDPTAAHSVDIKPSTVSPQQAWDSGWLDCQLPTAVG